MAMEIFLCAVQKAPVRQLTPVAVDMSPSAMPIGAF